MNTLVIARPAAPPAASPVLDRIFAAASTHEAANDIAAARTALLVRRRERAHRRSAH